MSVLTISSIFTSSGKLTTAPYTAPYNPLITYESSNLEYLFKKAGISLETAVMCATENPAKEIGIYDKVGSISVGKQADFVLIDDELNIKRVYIDGKEIIC